MYVYIEYIYISNVTRVTFDHVFARVHVQHGRNSVALIIDRSPSSFHSQQNWKANLDLITDRVFCLKVFDGNIF